MRIPDMVRDGALLLGAEGEAWLAGLPAPAAELVERVSTGVLNVRDGFEGAADFLTVADAWALAEPPPL
jgi:hypothetical protein